MKLIPLAFMLSVPAAVLLIVPACDTGRRSVINRIPREQYDELMHADIRTFDQTPGEGWRQFHDDPELQIRLIRDYMKKYPGSEAWLRWHLGQLYGISDDYRRAIALFERCSFDDSALSAHQIAWNHYVKGTIAFMRRDSVLLDRYIDSLQHHEVTMNIEVLERLRKNFDKAYKDAY